MADESLEGLQARLNRLETAYDDLIMGNKRSDVQTIGGGVMQRRAFSPANADSLRLEIARLKSRIGLMTGDMTHVRQSFTMPGV